jgi:flavorubredoxin
MVMAGPSALARVANKANTQHRIVSLRVKEALAPQAYRFADAEQRALRLAARGPQKETQMPVITEIASDLFRISTYVPPLNWQFNQFVARDDEPLLFHTGLKSLFPAVREAVARLLDPSTLRWIAFSHYEADECGALNEWLEMAPSAKPACSTVAALVSVDDVSTRRARQLADGEVLTIGKQRFRFLRTPHVPHAWDAGLMFEETGRTLLCSDLCHQNGDVDAITDTDVVESGRAALQEFQQGPLADYLPYTPYTGRTLKRLAALQPTALATMHGSTYRGDGAQVLRDWAAMVKDVLGGQ